MTRRSFLRQSSLAASAMATGCRSGSARRIRETRPIRVMTYNLHHGEGVDGRLDLERIAAVLRGVEPDLVALQEVDRRARRTGGVDQLAEYARLTGLHGWYGAAMPFQGGDYGQALLSRWPLLEPRVVRLPGQSDREPRIAVTASVDIPGIGRVRWTGVHLDASRDDTDRLAQAEALLREFGSEEHPGFLAGDFNATPDSRVMRRLLEAGTNWEDTAGAGASATIPAEAPRSRIDFVLASPRGGWETRRSVVLPEAVASDHRPLVVDLAWIRQEARTRSARAD